MYLAAQHVKRSGFTLIEFLMAVLILTVGLLAMLKVVGVAIEQNSSTKKKNDAIRICDDSLGVERSRLFSQLTSAKKNVSFKTNLGFVNYSIIENVTKLTTHSLSADQIPGGKQLQFTVAWREKSQRKVHSMTSTIIETAN